MNLDLANVHPHNWTVRQVIVFDWCDGPKEGLTSLLTPECEFWFEQVGERYNPEGLNDRLFKVSMLPPGTVDAVIRSLASLGTPTQPLWVPVWLFSSKEEQQNADKTIELLLAQAKPTNVLVESQDMQMFKSVDRASLDHIDVTVISLGFELTQ